MRSRACFQCRPCEVKNKSAVLLFVAALSNGDCGQKFVEPLDNGLKGGALLGNVAPAVCNERSKRRRKVFRNLHAVALQNEHEEDKRALKVRVRLFLREEGPQENGVGIHIGHWKEERKCSEGGRERVQKKKTHSSCNVCRPRSLEPCLETRRLAKRV